MELGWQIAFFVVGSLVTFSVAATVISDIFNRISCFLFGPHPSINDLAAEIQKAWPFPGCDVALTHLKLSEIRLNPHMRDKLIEELTVAASIAIPRFVEKAGGEYMTLVARSSPAYKSRRA
ncbi:hypothetical protein [Zavarzinella formosa]|uniref:hypothetical protein n=1 Tax=Zavarzinella formosa TaxID=360055 RepID=UPI0002F2C5D4|nr:hypothetical protein [Zavarzinella formosa]